MPGSLKGERPRKGACDVSLRARRQGYSPGPGGRRRTPASEGHCPAGRRLRGTLPGAGASHEMLMGPQLSRFEQPPDKREGGGSIPPGPTYPQAI